MEKESQEGVDSHLRKSHRWIVEDLHAYVMGLRVQSRHFDIICRIPIKNWGDKSSVERERERERERAHEVYFFNV